MKRDWLNAHPSQVIHLTPEPERVLDHLIRAHEEGTVFDVVNLDFCTHFCADTIEPVRLLFRSVLRPGGYLFLTVAKVSQAQLHGDRYRMIVLDHQAVEDILQYEAAKHGMHLNRIRGANTAYPSGNGLMFSYGWQLNREALDMKNLQLSEREKAAIVSLRRSGIDTRIIGKAFDIHPSSIPALVAWDTMRKAA